MIGWNVRRLTVSDRFVSSPGPKLLKTRTAKGSSWEPIVELEGVGLGASLSSEKAATLCC
jgi:hypothetical protein